MPLFLILAGGFIPALFWLWFWLREDALHPEPQGIIAFTFFLGMLAAPLSFPFEKMVSGLYSEHLFLTILLWAAIEEILKWSAASVAALHRKSMDEPIDAMIYLITAAVGFAAVENVFFLAGTLDSSVVQSALTGDLRFMGATLLHVISSSMVGLFIAGAFYHKKWVKRLATVGGICCAIALHALFNYLIIQGNDILAVFSAVWLAIVVLLLLFEKVKRIHPLKASALRK